MFVGLPGITLNTASIFKNSDTPNIDEELDDLFRKKQPINNGENLESYWAKIPTVFDHEEIWQIFARFFESNLGLERFSLSSLVTISVTECNEFRMHQSHRSRVEKQCRSKFIKAIDDLNPKFELIQKLLAEVHTAHTYLALTHFEADNRQALNMSLIRTGIFFFKESERVKDIRDNVIFFNNAKQIVIESGYPMSLLVFPLEKIDASSELKINQLKKLGELLFQILYKAKYKAYFNTSFVNSQFAALEVLWGA